MDFVGISVEGSRDAGSHVITYFAIPPGKEEAAGRDLLRCLTEGFQVCLRNDLDEGGEGCTLFRQSASGLETMSGGHGWSSNWTPTDEVKFLSKVTELAHLNRGGHCRQGSLNRHIEGKPYITTSGLTITKSSTNIMTQATKRSILRWTHLIFSIPIIGYAYSPFEELPNYAPVVRFVAVPAIVLTGLWMWKGHVLRRLISKKSLAVLE